VNQASWMGPDCSTTNAHSKHVCEEIIATSESGPNHQHGQTVTDSTLVTSPTDGEVHLPPFERSGVHSAHECAKSLATLGCRRPDRVAGLLPAHLRARLRPDSCGAAVQRSGRHMLSTHPGAGVMRAAIRGEFHLRIAVRPFGRQAKTEPILQGIRGYLNLRARNRLSFGRGMERAHRETGSIESCPTSRRPAMNYCTSPRVSSMNAVSRFSSSSRNRITSKPFVINRRLRKL